MQGCEEDNLHFKIVSVKESDFKQLEGNIVLPEFDKSLENAENNGLFFPFPTLERTKFTVEGHYSRRPHNIIRYGCLGSHKFKIVKVLEVQYLDESYSYPIDNR